MKKWPIVQISDLVSSFGMDKTLSAISEFSCPLNTEIENFLKDDAIDFTARMSSMTHLVIDPADSSFVGYFTLAHKPFFISADKLSNSQRKRMERFAKVKKSQDGSIVEYVVSAFLIAQLGKNFGRSGDEGLITGAGLLLSAFERISIAQHEIGGQVVFLECEDGNRKLRAFYEKNAFVACGKRTDEEDGITYLQMFRFLKSSAITWRAA